MNEAPATVRKELEDRAVELYEWLSLVSLESPRIDVSDSIDPYLSRYQSPAAVNVVCQKVVRIKWCGLLPASWITELWLRTLLDSDDLLVQSIPLTCPNRFAVRASSADNSWFALSVYGFAPGFLGGGQCFTVLRQPRSKRREMPDSCLSPDGPEDLGGREDLDGYILWEFNRGTGM